MITEWIETLTQTPIVRFQEMKTGRWFATQFNIPWGYTWIEFVHIHKDTIVEQLVEEIHKYERRRFS